MVCDKAKNSAESSKKRSPTVIPEDSKSVTRRMSFTYRFYSTVYPEIALFDTNKDRRVALRRARSMLSRQPGAFFGGVWVLYFLIVFSFIWAEPLAAHPVLERIAFFLLAALMVPIWIWPCKRRVRISLREQLVAKGVPICVGCGYDLRGQIEPCCPECGAAFDEKLLNPSEGKPEEPRPRA